MGHLPDLVFVKGPPQVPLDCGSPELEQVQTEYAYVEDCDGKLLLKSTFISGASNKEEVVTGEVTTGDLLVYLHGMIVLRAKIVIDLKIDWMMMFNTVGL